MAAVRLSDIIKTWLNETSWRRSEHSLMSAQAHTLNLLLGGAAAWSASLNKKYLKYINTKQNFYFAHHENSQELELWLCWINDGGSEFSWFRTFLFCWR